MVGEQHTDDSLEWAGPAGTSAATGGPSASTSAHATAAAAVDHVGTQAAATETAAPGNADDRNPPASEDDVGGDADSALGEDEEDPTESLSESIMQYRYIHGRSYHSLRQGNADYWAPNDARQNEALDYHHQAFTRLLDEQLFLAPIRDPKKILDAGCGTGIWALDVADQYPGALVYGSDLSPIMPIWTGPNCKFELDDMTRPWTYKPGEFDFIHLRNLYGSIQDWDMLFREAFKCCSAGGYIESFESCCYFRSDDGSVAPGMALDSWGAILAEAGYRKQRPMDVVERGIIGGALRRAGFVDLVVRREKVPVTGWPTEEKQRAVGQLNQAAMTEGLEGYLLYLATSVLDWSPEEVHLFTAGIRKELKSRCVHPWYWVEIIHARKPQ